MKGKPVPPADVMVPVFQEYSARDAAAILGIHVATVYLHRKRLGVEGWPWARTSRVLNTLADDGGWATVDRLALESGYPAESVSRMLYRWRNAGRVEHRNINGYREWRAC